MKFKYLVLILVAFSNLAQAYDPFDQDIISVNVLTAPKLEIVGSPTVKINKKSYLGDVVNQFTFENRCLEKSDDSRTVYSEVGFESGVMSASELESHFLGGRSNKVAEVDYLDSYVMQNEISGVASIPFLFDWASKSQKADHQMENHFNVINLSRSVQSHRKPKLSKYGKSVLSESFDKFQERCGTHYQWSYEKSFKVLVGYRASSPSKNGIYSLKARIPYSQSTPHAFFKSFELMRENKRSKHLIKGLNLDMYIMQVGGTGQLIKYLIAKHSLDDRVTFHTGENSSSHYLKLNCTQRDMHECKSLVDDYYIGIQSEEFRNNEISKMATSSRGFNKFEEYLMHLHMGEE